MKIFRDHGRWMVSIRGAGNDRIIGECRSFWHMLRVIGRAFVWEQL
jgi:hypothetical protein